jgi:hypothetical protein
LMVATADEEQRTAQDERGKEESRRHRSKRAEGY